MDPQNGFFLETLLRLGCIISLFILFCLSLWGIFILCQRHVILRWIVAVSLFFVIAMGFTMAQNVIGLGKNWR